jgi:hypothetical protein
MIRRQVFFEGAFADRSTLGVAQRADAIQFPTNVLQCVFMISETMLTLDSTGNPVTTLGAGVKNVSFNPGASTVVSYTAWAEFVTILSEGSTWGINTWLKPEASYLTLVCTALCE